METIINHKRYGEIKCKIIDTFHSMTRIILKQELKRKDCTFAFDQKIMIRNEEYA